MTRKSLWRSLYFQVLVGIALGCAVGLLWPATGAALQPVAQGFINLVRMVIAPVIFLTLVTGIAHLGNLGELARVAWKAFAYFITLSTFALIVGLIVANTVRPGAGLHADAAALDAAAISGYVHSAKEQSIASFLLQLIPNTLPGGVVNGEILQVLLVSLLVGISAVLVGERARPFVAFCESALAIVFRLIELLMRLAPLAAFGGMAYTLGKFGVTSLKSLALLIASFYGTSLLFVIVVLGAVARASGFALWKLLRYLRDELLLVLGTSSSESALPRLMEKLEAAGCSRAVVSVVVPTGYSFNLDGTNIYMTLAALFVAQATDVHLSLGQQLGLLAVAMLSSKGAAGVTGAGFITLAATLAIVPSVPVAGMALIIGIDRFMSECRALTNFIGNAVATVVVSRWEGVLDRERLRRRLEQPAAPVGIEPASVEPGGAA